MTAHCGECGALNVADVEADCTECGETIGVSCADCGRIFALSDLTDRCCEDCEGDRLWLAERERRAVVEDGRGDWMHDLAKRTADAWRSGGAA